MLKKAKKINFKIKTLLITIILSFSNTVLANTTVVSGIGSATCPSGYVVTGMVVNSLNPPNTGWGDSINSSGFIGCTVSNTSSVSGCRAMHNIDWDTTSDWPSTSTSVTNATISVYCAKTCGN